MMKQYEKLFVVVETGKFVLIEHLCSLLLTCLLQIQLTSYYSNDNSTILLNNIVDNLVHTGQHMHAMLKPVTREQCCGAKCEQCCQQGCSAMITIVTALLNHQYYLLQLVNKLGWATMITIANKLVLSISFSSFNNGFNNRCCMLHQCWTTLLKHEKHCSCCYSMRCRRMCVEEGPYSSSEMGENDILCYFMTFYALAKSEWTLTELLSHTNDFSCSCESGQESLFSLFLF